MIPNAKTQEVIDATDRGENLIRFSSAKEMFEYLGIGVGQSISEEDWI